MAPIDRSWQPRRRFAGTYDQAWSQRVRPLLPHDYDPAFAQAAPLDQRPPAPLVGGERMTLIKVLDMHYEQRLQQIKARVGAHFGNSELFQNTWDDATDRARSSDENRSGPASYPPGTCAAQGVLLLLMEEGAVVAAMTERWFSSDEKETQAKIEYIDARWGDREIKVEKFQPGETVPPCGACELIVPLLLCSKDKPTCNHKT